MALAAGCAVGYGWWATGLHAFTTACYVAVGVPVAVVGVAALSHHPAVRPQNPGVTRPGREGSLWNVAPVAAVALVGVALEVAALILGGRSTTVPTISTVIDQAMRWHPLRLGLFLAWLAIGARAAWRLWFPVPASEHRRGARGSGPERPDRAQSGPAPTTAGG